ncbi:MAG: DEAD/DEAH box helicase, partial [Rikenellaceae bacterium]|nr:DEAD/DEAH box helicase [Rikenellaceae bacterium]
MQKTDLTAMFAGLRAVKELCGPRRDCPTVHLHGVAGSCFSVALAAVAQKTGGVHVAVMEDRDKAAYLAADLYALADPGKVMFFPTAYKRSIQFGQEDPSGIVQRTAALNAIRSSGGGGSAGTTAGAGSAAGYLIICTWPEALIEKVVDPDRMSRSTLTVNRGDKLSMAFVEEILQQGGFERVDFVHEPGQYALRGGIIDLFSYAGNQPYRLDFFGDTVDSIRPFKVASQLSEGQVEQVEIVPNLKRIENAGGRVSFARFADGAGYWMEDLDYTLKRFNSIRTKILADLDEPSEIDQLVTGRKGFLEDTASSKMYLLADRATERVAECTVEFDCAPQPVFNKRFEMLADDIVDGKIKGYKTYILSENRLQTERLENIFHSIGKPEAEFTALPVTLHEGFICHGLKLNLYTDHQIFDRYHRYRLRGEIDRGESLTVAELNTLQIGDYVTHIDHGVGRFGGLVRTTENGKVHEAVKLVYKDGDVLLVNVHALHRIARYKDKDADVPKIYKLGSGAWQRMKAATKKSVKDIARELIALYAARKASGGFRFSPDSYLQQEMEASFRWEETPDQEKAIEAVKQDMESPQPMDRLICGDVGFGKTEVAIRAAFKAASDSRQVAVLVPTTILSLQHYRTFSERLRDFPVRVEHLSRAKTAKETRQILEDLKAGKIDILIGTHKILGKDVQFKSLGLLIIDEEQKFGVGAKEKLRQLSVSVDTMTLTATPIPRTLQFSLMGSRDLSVISTPPPNRQPIVTESHVFDEQIVKEAIDFELARHGQVYVVHNRVDDIGKVDALVRRLCPGVRTLVGHG